MVDVVRSILVVRLCLDSFRRRSTRREPWFAMYPDCGRYYLNTSRESALLDNGLRYISNPVPPVGKTAVGKMAYFAPVARKERMVAAFAVFAVYAQTHTGLFQAGCSPGSGGFFENSSERVRRNQVSSLGPGGIALGELPVRYGPFAMCHNSGRQTGKNPALNRVRNSRPLQEPANRSWKGGNKLPGPKRIGQVSNFAQATAWPHTVAPSQTSAKFLPMGRKDQCLTSAKPVRILHCPIGAQAGPIHGESPPRGFHFG